MWFECETQNADDLPVVTAAATASAVAASTTTISTVPVATATAAATTTTAAITTVAITTTTAAAATTAAVASATAAASAETTTTTAAAAATTATAAFFGFVHSKRTAATVGAIESFHGSLTGLAAGKGHESEAALTASVPIDGIEEVSQRLPGFKHTTKLGFGGFVRDIAYIQFHGLTGWLMVGLLS